MRNLPHTDKEINDMLATVGLRDIEELFRGIPETMRCREKLRLGDGMSEQELVAHLRELASKNDPLSGGVSFIGAGAYRHYVPTAVSELASRSEFVTPYTPYQPEISQGTLQVLYEYQTMIARLFAMDVSNASHYSGATACADACLMAKRVGKRRTKIIVPDSLHPEYRRVLKTVLTSETDVTELPSSSSGLIDRKSLSYALDDSTAAVLAQYPNFFGIVEDLKDISDSAHAAGALFITVTPEPLALSILKPPGEFGADIAVGEGLSFGLPVCFGGPSLGIFTCSEKLVRQMPGRICGKAFDSEGRQSYTLTLSTREQHIRREKATSNICSNQALCATTAAIYLSLLGREGLRELAHINLSLAEYAKEKLSSTGKVRLPFQSTTFNEFVIEVNGSAEDVISRLASQKIFAGVNLSRWYEGMENRILVCCTEMTNTSEIDRFAEALKNI
ncbi:MAG TPA: aminomethyl-transferring glycine dehydrogenase subunit GcvPA [bacterium]|nr:aminomethyl-transferring glycine dehydrogenase subunit GcvPA [Myxococcales bacterium]OQA58980.1 MAG: putative glycine dehydrogenase (decarboxylating) subunit 1 [bacterium ADurb.Bin270]HPW45232.1 aminomethyl-transferring glycine dehydrogenase subunit GcvPA [bacterium]HQC51016.1 aminomethyl-transferring glycine dehydrogenase subunit GcvPA [bacterium]HQG13628.1 aminomethyl-transferring glycine dehydrogenase subunit GcvPA [bacterium]